ncbi:MAG: hypothetical protein F4045_05860 [Chloroflexi bacterium]|nr:hypothetical protein [Chloroflexota bacterium]MYK34631.1 hypothetical protein [Chloroflexota bacterium]
MVSPSGAMGVDPLSTALRLWGPSIDGEEIQRLRSRYLERVDDDEWDDVVQTAASILGQCPNPTDRERRVTGLALGKVQSGKTLSYTSLIALAIDNGYRLTVVLAGTKNPLLEQNYTRLYNDLEAGRPSLTPFKNPTPQDADVVRSVLYSGGHALIVVLKHRGRLDDTRRVLSTPELRGFPTLIIDDEGDEASLNTQFRRGRSSAIYRNILALRGALQVHAYVAYTATPQANLLISGIDGLSPDFGVLVEPGKGYCGGATFFGPNRDRYVKLVSLAEAEDEQVQGVPDGLRQAIATFLVGGAIRHLRESNVRHSMLIHNSDSRASHERLQAAIKNLMELWRDSLRLSDNDPAKHELMLLMRVAYDDLCSTAQQPPTWEEVRAQLLHEAWLVEVWMVNSLRLGRDPIGTPLRLKNNILVGGNMLGRGVTIEGLAVTYITRRAKNDTNADTMEQRARWFGYKNDYLDVCRIYVSARLRDDYTELLRHEDDFWEALRRNQRQQLSIREWPRMLSLDSNMGLKPTRSSVASFRRFGAVGWDVQEHPIEDEAVAARNLQSVRLFLAQHTEAYARRFGNVEHLVIEDCPTEDVISGLLANIETEGTGWDASYTSEYLARLLLAGVLPSLNVMFMVKGGIRERTKRKGRVNPMQGRTPGRDSSDPRYYPGDENIHEGRVQFQVHVVRVKGDGLDRPVETTALALFIPKDDPRFDLRYVVRDDNP